MTSKFMWASFFLISASSFGQEGGRGGGGAPSIADDATEQQIKSAVATVRVGRKLTPASWSNGARVAVCFTVDIDNETLQRRNPLPVPLSGGEYGATTGLPRILALLDHEQIPATFFIPAMSAMLHPEMIPAILKNSRNDIGLHGWVHESWPSITDMALEERLLDQSIEYLTRATGTRPIGVRAPSSAFSLHSLELIRKAGLQYDSSLMGMDEPYEIMSNGKRSGIIEIPMSNILNDYEYYGENATGALPSPEALFEIYKGEFDLAYRERTLVSIMLHPHVSGHRSRVLQVEKFIDYMKSKPDVWFASMREVAAYIRKQDGSLREQTKQ